MPRKSNPVDALKKLREQREELAAKEAKLRDEAAIVLGHILIECGAETIEPAQLRQIVRGAMALGIEETLKRRSEEHTSELQSLMRSSYAVFCLKKQRTRY